MARKQKKKENCLVCGKLAEKCHVRSKKSGGPNDAYNILALCRIHHMRQHRVGWRQFLDENPTVYEELVLRGWEIEFVYGRFLMTHSRLREK